MINDIDVKLIEEARDLIKKRATKREPPRHTRLISVGCALSTNKGNVYSGVNIETRCAPCSICAEYSAISSMVSSGERKIKTIVAVLDSGEIILPCGKCLEFIYEITSGDNDVEIIKSESEKIKLKELLPHPWQENLE